VGAAAAHGVRAAEHRRKERKTVFTGLIRTIILYILIIAGIRLMGKRQVGELEPSELVLSLITAARAAVPMQDFGIPLLTGVVPIPRNTHFFFCV